MLGRLCRFPFGKCESAGQAVRNVHDIVQRPANRRAMQGGSLRLAKGEEMFTTVRKYRVRQGSVDELAQRVREGFVPLVRQMRGFKGYYLVDGGPDVLITINVFDSADQALASNEKAADWVRNNVLEFTKGVPEVLVGNVLIAEVK
jgi:heme-degrading monooxygenase HmoA